MSKVRGYWIDVYGDGKAKEVAFKDTLENIYDILGVDVIDVATRKVGEYAIDFIVDDEGLLKDEAIPSALDENGKPMLVGNLLCVSSDNEGNFASLTDEMLEELKKHTATAMIMLENGAKMVNVLDGIEYLQ